MERPIAESACQRARHDTRQARHSDRFFWCWEGVGVVVLGSVGGWIGYCLTPQDASGDTAFIFPLVGSAVGAMVGLVVTFGLIFLWNLLRAPIKQRNEARERVCVLEEKRMPCIMAKPNAGGQYPGGRGHKHLRWAELEVTNRSSSLPLTDVAVRLVRCQRVIWREGDEPEYMLDSWVPAWDAASIYWSKGDELGCKMKVPLNPGQTKAALVAYQDDLSDIDFVFNVLTCPKHIGGAKIDIEITSRESAPLQRSYYIAYFPDHFPDTAMVLIEWEKWAQTNALSIPDTEGAPNE